MNQIRLLTFFFVVIFIGCRPLKNLSPTTYQIEPIKKNEFEKLNGRYYNFQDTVFGKITHNPARGIDENNKKLLDRLFVFLPDKAYDNVVTVEIKFISNRLATVNVYENDVFIFTKNISGKIKNGYFYVSPKVFIVPFFPIFYWHNFEQVRIGKVGNDIVLDHTLNSWGITLFGGGSDKGFSTSIYKKLKE